AEHGAIRDSRMAIDYLASGVSSRRYARITISTAVRASARAAARACSYSCRVGFEICNFNAPHSVTDFRAHATPAAGTGKTERPAADAGCDEIVSRKPLSKGRCYP